MSVVFLRDTKTGAYYSADGIRLHHLTSMSAVNTAMALYGKGPANKDIIEVTTDQLNGYGSEVEAGAGGGLTQAEVAAVVRTELDKTKLGS